MHSDSNSAFAPQKSFPLLSLLRNTTSTNFHHNIMLQNALRKIVRFGTVELERLQIYSRGRFGAWMYEISNQDHPFMQGAEITIRLLGSLQETTLASVLGDFNATEIPTFLPVRE